ncbi:magnesium transporter CorA family protein [Oleisolibacter albus]|uniref:magnesium transporter CorA family protein n=1 Tax=Oleisolibacter albus TaxID=2171757 RepID=UPI000DF2FEF2|nr:magnesium transporter CorA family protein [Oleisolibacter albus]
MLTFHALAQGCLVPVQSTIIGPDVLWVDLHNPTPDEETLLEQQIHLDVPTRAEMRDIEASSRLYVERGMLMMTADLVANATGPDPQIEPVTFIITPQRLITVRYCELRSFALFLQGCSRQPIPRPDPWAVLLGLLETVVERLAESLERVGDDLNDLTRRIFRKRGNHIASAAQPRADLSLMLERIGQHHDVVSKVRASLLTLSRLAGFVLQRREAQRLTAETVARLEALKVDLASLSEHDGVLSAKVDFMLDATLGLINVEQNGIIKIFSVMSVIFMPPTMVASIYGMNFEWMPELKWPWGYPAALLVMLAAAVLPYLYFKWRRWL